MSLYEPIFDELNQGSVRYVVVGGPAVILHGFARLTAEEALLIAWRSGALRDRLGAEPPSQPRNPSG